MTNCNTTAQNINQDLKSMKLATSLKDNVETLEGLFKDDDTLRFRHVENTNGIKFCLIFCDGLIDGNMINEHAVKPLLLMTDIEKGEGISERIMSRLIMANEVSTVTDFKEIVESVTYGDTLLLIDGSQTGIMINSKGFMLRGVAEPSVENILSGPREGFGEAVMINLSMIHRKLRTHHLKIKFTKLGNQTKTQLAVCYLDNIVNHQILSEVMRRLESIDIDSVLDANYIDEFIRDSKWSPFRSTGYTERPDVVAGKLLEGRIAIFVDGSPVVLTIPYLFIENFQSNEDYYLNFYYTTFTRLLRLTGFALTILLPALYIAAVSFHHEILPTQLLMILSGTKRFLPMPAFAETLIMMLAFDLLKETGIRVPFNIGQALGVVGGIVVGQAAVEANLVSAPMVIMVAVAGVTNLIIPKLSAAALILRYALFVLAATFGLFGMLIGLSLMLIHILNLKSFGVSQLSAVGSIRFGDVKDTFFRAPWPKMINRTAPIAQNATRMKNL